MEHIFSFRPAKLRDKDLIFSWLENPHMLEFWDNSQAHKDDILNFMQGRNVPSDYFDGMFDYWVGLLDDIPFSLIMTHYEFVSQETPEPYLSNISQSGKTLGLDFGIGNIDYLGKGFSASTLRRFMDFYRQDIDQEVTRFIIDPLLTNPRAIHVYQKAGFEIVGDFIQETGYFDGQKGVIMKKDF